MKSDDRHIAVRLDGATLERLEAVRSHLDAPATQAEALRAVIQAGLEALERKHPPPRHLHLVPDPPETA
jgi:predicted DNA-binding protein